MATRADAPTPDPREPLAEALGKVKASQERLREEAEKARGERETSMEEEEPSA